MPPQETVRASVTSWGLFYELYAMRYWMWDVWALSGYSQQSLSCQIQWQLDCTARSGSYQSALPLVCSSPTEVRRKPVQLTAEIWSTAEAPWKILDQTKEILLLVLIFVSNLSTKAKIWNTQKPLNVALLLNLLCLLEEKACQWSKLKFYLW